MRRIENWQVAAKMRLQPNRQGLRLLNFRDGFNIVCRAGTGDWAVVHELFFAGGYGRALEHLRSAGRAPTVLDLGGNIGLFSLLAASQRQDVSVHAFEPGPPNQRLFEVNRWLNGELSERIHLHREAVADVNSTVQWTFDSANPGGSSLYGTISKAQSFPVTVRSFADVVCSLEGRISLAKIDIEGAEFDLLRGTPARAWDCIDAVALELHDDPAGEMSQAAFLDRMKTCGFTIEEGGVCSWFMYR